MKRTMSMNEDAYALLNSVLDTIQDAAAAALLNKSPRDSCLKIGGLVFEAKQILKNELSFNPEGDGPKAA